MEISYRLIEKKDNPYLAQIIRNVLTEFNANKPGTVFTDTTTDSLYELFQTTNSSYWVVEENQKLLGGCSLFPTLGLPDGCIELVKLYLTEESRGKGIGKTLLELAINFAEEKGYKQIYLESLPQLNMAIDLYEKMGFQHLDNPLGNSGHFACNLWMIKNSNQ